MSQSLWYPATDGPRHNKAPNGPRQYNRLDDLRLLGRALLLQRGVPLAVARNALRGCAAVCETRAADPLGEIFGWGWGRGRGGEREGRLKETGIDSRQWRWLFLTSDYASVPSVRIHFLVPWSLAPALPPPPSHRRPISLSRESPPLAGLSAAAFCSRSRQLRRADFYARRSLNGGCYVAGSNSGGSSNGGGT